MTRSPLRIGILGTGYTATRHAQAYQALGLTPFVSLGRNQHRAREFQKRFSIPHNAETLDEFLALRPTAVSLCTPTPTHAELTQACLKAGISLLVEKPVVETQEDLASLAPLITRQAFIMAGHTELFQPTLLRLMAFLDRQALGKVHRITVTKQGQDQSPKGDTPFFASTPRSVRDHLVHLLYLIHRASGHAEPWTINKSELSFHQGRALFQGDFTLKEDIQATLVMDERPNQAMKKELLVEAEHGSLRWGLGGQGPHAEVTLNGKTKALPDYNGESFTVMVKHFLSHIHEQSLPQEDLRAGFVVGKLACDLTDPCATAEPRPSQSDAADSSGPFEALKKQAKSCWSDQERNQLLSELKTQATAFDKQGEESDPRMAALLSLIRRHATKHGLHWRNLDTLLTLIGKYPSASVELLEEKLALASTQDELREAVFRFDITCNQRCLFCNVMTPVHKEIKHTTDEALHALQKLREEGFNALTLTGGEPTLRKDLAQVIRTAKELGFHWVNLQTNAVRLADTSLCEELVRAGLDRAMVSLHSHRADVSDGLTQAPGTFHKTVQGIRNLTAQGVSVGLSHVLTTRNASDLVTFVQFVTDQLPQVTRLDLMLNQHMGAGKEHPDLLPRFDDVEPHLPEAIRIAEEHGMAIHNALTIPPCRFGGRWDLTLEYARLRQFELEGRRFDNQTDLVRREKTKGNACRRCVLDPYCYGVWQGYADIHGLDDLRPLHKEDLRRP